MKQGEEKQIETVSNVRKSAEFLTFIKAVGAGELPDTWELMAESLGVRPSTISDWKKLPEFQDALMKGIRRCIDQMESTGKRDWKMWREKAKILTRENHKLNGIGVEVTDKEGNRIVKVISWSDAQKNE